MSSLLSVKNVTSGYGQVTVLRDVTVDVEQGEIVAILGSNGAGKSTLLKTIAGMIRPSSGSVELDGNEVSGKSPDRIARSGLVLVPEGRQLFDTMTVLDNLMLGSYQYRRDRAAAKTALDQVYELFPILKERSSQTAGSMSGGQQQMVAIGRGMMVRPKVLLLDEPSLGLAPAVLQEVLASLSRLRERGTTILIVEQNAVRTLELADRAYVLDHGSVTVQGPCSELLSDQRVKQAYLGLDLNELASVTVTSAGVAGDPQ
jgi:branched-chain amino acid transport system ATP-binding protein